jgi:uncharacterized RDD family membrane protein YckC
MDSNQPDVNPFAPPTADVDFGTQAQLAPGEAALADRGTRLGAALLDGLLYVVAMIPAIIAGISAGSVSEGGNYWVFKAMTNGVGIITAVAWLGLVIYQAYLVSTTGQTLGKRWTKIKIVKMDGSPVNFVSGVLLRAWLIAIVQQIPVINIISGLLDPLLIFREDRRCLHDHIAGTKVIVAG